MVKMFLYKLLKYYRTILSVIHIYITHPSCSTKVNEAFVFASTSHSLIIYIKFQGHALC